MRHYFCSIKQLTPEDAPILQKLYQQCTEFAILTDGVPPSPTAALDEFQDLPPGKTTQDKFIFGLFDSGKVLLGMIESIRHYPDNQTWWLGLMMLAPEYRGKGLGADFYRAFEGWVSAQNIAKISLLAIEVNKPGLRFWQKMGFEIVQTMPPRQFGIKTHKYYILSRQLKN